MMLIKLGKLWIDPSKLMGVEVTKDNRVDITLTENNVFTTVICTDEKHAEICCDEIARIVNEALITQSFGNGSEESTA